MTSGARGRPRLLGITAGAVALALAVTGSAAAEPPSRRTADGKRGGPVLPVGKTYTVTLLTGDVVTVAGRGSACPTVTVRLAKPSGVQHRGCGPDGHLRVVPGEVAGLLGSVLDESLFDVTALILAGHDDAGTDALPLIVRPGGVGARSAGALGADPLAASLSQRRALPVIDAVAGRQPKRTGPEFLDRLRSRVPDQPGARAAATGPRVWLDRRVRASGLTQPFVGAPVAAVPGTPAPDGRDAARGAAKLDRNLTQISAPQAWRSGITGQGTRVAVLDTGADFSHPDLTGQVVERADFSTPDGDAVDRHGHGTHLAATIAGTGAAADGARRGVAPDADLLVGKVLDDGGFGTESQVIAGMEWAAPQADVVNLSLGGDLPSDGTDPMSLAVDALTRQHGALFVIAAGNSGPVEGSVSTPGAAGLALTVGAVDATDRIADFSSRGPLVGTRAAKPELVAPGVDIVAARAAGTLMGDPVDDRYTVASGTSMATPHVAGAAALLVQKHPDWSADRLKSALVGAADPLPDADGYAVGAGRLDAARALNRVVSEQDLVDLGTFAHPQSGTASTSLSWRNTGTSRARLELGLTVTRRDGELAPAGAGRLSAGNLTLAPDGIGTVTLRLDRARFAAARGYYLAVVTARTPEGTFLASTPVAFYVEPPSFDLALSTTALPDASVGADQFGGVRVVNLDDPALFNRFVALQPGEPATVRVPAGRYTMAGYQLEVNLDSDARMALVGDPDVTVDADTTLVADAGRARPLRGSVDGVPTVANQAGITYRQLAANGRLVSEDFAFAWGAVARAGGAFTVPMEKPGTGTFEAYLSFSLQAPDTERSPFQYDVVRSLPDGIPADPTYRVSPAEQAQLIRIDQTFHRLDKPDSTTSHKRYGTTADGLYVLDTRTDSVPDTRVDYLTPGYRYGDEAFYSGVIEWAAVTQEAHHQYAAGSRHRKTWVRQPLRPDWYDDPDPSYSECRPAPIRRTSTLLQVELVDLTDQHQRFDCLGFHDSWSETTRRLTLHRNGQLVGEHPDSYGEFTVPQQAGEYRLGYHLEASALLPVSTRVDTTWTFRSSGPTGTDRVPVPLLSVDYALPLDVANHPTGGVATFTVRQSHGVPAQQITGFEVWASTDDGTTWQPATVQPAGVDSYTATLPVPGAGRAVSLRVTATADGGSAIDQTIIRAYQAG